MAWWTLEIIDRKKNLLLAILAGLILLVVLLIVPADAMKQMICDAEVNVAGKLITLVDCIIILYVNYTVVNVEEKSFETYEESQEYFRAIPDPEVRS